MFIQLSKILMLTVLCFEVYSFEINSSHKELREISNRAVIPEAKEPQAKGKGGVYL